MIFAIEFILFYIYIFIYYSETINVVLFFNKYLNIDIRVNMQIKLIINRFISMQRKFILYVVTQRNKSVVYE